MSIVFIKLFTYEAIYIKNHYIAITYIREFDTYNRKKVPRSQ